jgi:hypothetical protein
VAARCVTNRFWFMVWRDTGASARATARAARPSGVHPDEDAVGQKRRSHPLRQDRDDQFSRIKHTEGTLR